MAKSTLPCRPALCLHCNNFVVDSGLYRGNYKTISPSRKLLEPLAFSQSKSLAMPIVLQFSSEIYKNQC